MKKMNSFYSVFTPRREQHALTRNGLLPSDLVEAALQNGRPEGINSLIVWLRRPREVHRYLAVWVDAIESRIAALLTVAEVEILLEASQGLTSEYFERIERLGQQRIAELSKSRSLTHR